MRTERHKNRAIYLSPTHKTENFCELTASGDSPCLFATLTVTLYGGHDKHTYYCKMLLFSLASQFLIFCSILRSGSSTFSQFQTFFEVNTYVYECLGWLVDADSRPSFSQLHAEFSKMSKDSERYLEIKVNTLHVLHFNARCYASAVCGVVDRLSVCPSVCLSVRHKSLFY